MFKEPGLKPKTVEKIIKQKIKGWINSIEDEYLKENLSSHVIVTGGCIASMLLGEDVNDFDIYLSCPDIAQKLSMYYVNKLGPKSDKVSNIGVEIQKIEDWHQLKINIKSAGISGPNVDHGIYQYFEYMNPLSITEYFDRGFKAKSDKKFELLHISSNAITLSSDIQIITRFIGPADVIHKCYDFIHVKNYFTYEEGLVLNTESLTSIMSKELKYNNSRFPVASLFRLRKFIKRGWRISAGEILKIAFDISKLDLSDIDVLQEQTTGVDQAYFAEVLSILRKDSNRKIDQTYLFSVIDKIFNEENDDLDNEKVKIITQEV